MEPAHRIHLGGKLIALVLVVSLAISGCALEKHNWTYSLTRQVYSKETLSSLASARWEGELGLALAGMIFVLPVVIDTAILPVTVTHDFVLDK